jgi:hypothetical protein
MEYTWGCWDSHTPEMHREMQKATMYTHTVAA